MPGVERRPSLARGYRDTPRDSPRLGIINHVMQGRQATMIRWADERPFRTPKSANFTFGRSGRIVQHVAARDSAWAAGGTESPTWPLLPAGMNPNKVAVNFECEGFAVPPIDWRTGKLAYGYDYCYGPTGSTDSQGRDQMPWPEPLIAAVLRVTDWLFDEGVITGDRNADTITGHFATATRSRKFDPGPYWVQTVQPRLIAAPAVIVLTPPVDGVSEARVAGIEDELVRLAAQAHPKGHLHIPGTVVEV